MRSALQATLIIVATVALTVATIQAKDPLPFAIVGALAIAGLFLLDPVGRWLGRWLADHYPRLAPRSEQLAKVINKGVAIHRRLRELPMDTPAEDVARWETKVNEWAAEAQELLRQKWPEWLAAFQISRSSMAVDHIGQRAGNLSAWLERKIVVLLELQARP